MSTASLASGSAVSAPGSPPLRLHSPAAPRGWGLGVQKASWGPGKFVSLLATLLSVRPHQPLQKASPARCPRSEATPHPCSGSQSTLLRFLVLGGFAGTASDRPLQTALSVRGDKSVGWVRAQSGGLGIPGSTKWLCEFKQVP